MGIKHSKLPTACCNDKAMAFDKLFTSTYTQLCNETSTVPNVDVMNCVKEQMFAVQTNANFSLSMRKLPLDEYVVEALVKTITNEPHICGLDVAYCSISNPRYIERLAMAASHCIRLTWLDFSGNIVVDDAVRALIDILKSDNGGHINSLSLNDTSISSDAASELADFLSSSYWLRSLAILENDGIGEASVRGLVKAVIGNASTSAIELNKNMIPKDLRIELQNSLSRNASVTAIIDDLLQSACKRQFHSKMTRFQHSMQTRVNARAAGTKSAPISNENTDKPVNVYHLVHADKEEVAPTPSVRFDAGGAVMLGRRNEMQDIILMAGDFPDLFGVFDGHGGRDAAKYCAKHLPFYIQQRLPKDVIDEISVKEALTQSFINCDEAMSPFCGSLGTTATIALIRDSLLFVAHVGDSKAILICNDGSVEVVTRDHHPSDSKEAERLALVNGIVLNGRIGGVLSVSRVLGDSNLKGQGITAVPDVAVYSLDGRYKQLIIASDGVWEVLSPKQVSDVSYDQPDAAITAERIRDMAYISKSQDNISVIVIIFDQSNGIT